MKIYSLTGKSGTGKSFQAINFCKKNNIKGIIDDGLFIYDNKVIEGISAKKQDNTIGAIKTALFLRKDHREKTKNAIKILEPESILIIGTSDEMTDRIVKALDLPKISKRIYIENISTEDDIKNARKQRDIYGKHVVPVPTLQLKRDFAGYFLNPIKLYKEITSTSKKDNIKFSVVRPTYSYMGNFYIAEKVFLDIAKCLVKKFRGIDSIVSFYTNSSPDSFVINAIIRVNGKGNITRQGESFQRELIAITEFMTAYNVVEVNLELQ